MNVKSIDDAFVLVSLVSMAGLVYTVITGSVFIFSVSGWAALLVVALLVAVLVRR